MKKITLIVVFCAMLLKLYAPGSQQDPREKFVNWMAKGPVTTGALRWALEYNHIAAGDVVLAQSLLETGSFTSELCTSYNNLFGMKMPSVRETTAWNCTDKGYAMYKTWYDCVKDMKLFQEWYLTRGHDLVDYYQFLSTIGYATDPEYLQKVKLLCTTS